MEFNEKLQQLRKQMGLTQEELAEALFVSRTAVSKWEQGKGYPNIESLKAIAKFFDVTIDELLSSEQVLSVAEEDNKQKRVHIRDLIFSLIDISALMFFFLPLFGEKTDGKVLEVSLLSLTAVAPYIKLTFILVVALVVLWGVLMLVMQNLNSAFFTKYKCTVSFLLSVIGILLFVLCLQPYVSTVLFVFLIIKLLVFIKTR